MSEAGSSQKRFGDGSAPVESCSLLLVPLGGNHSTGKGAVVTEVLDQNVVQSLPFFPQSE